MTPSVTMRPVPPRDDVPRLYKERIAAHLRDYMRRHRIEDVAEIERRLDVASGTGTRVLGAQRLGLGVFIKIAKLLGGADFLLFEAPRTKVGEGRSPAGTRTPEG